MAGKGVARRGRNKYNGKGPRERMREEELILSRYNNGVPLSEILVEFDISRTTFDRRLDSALQRRVALHTDQYRETMNAGLDEQMVAVGKVLNAAEGMVRAAGEREDFDLLDRGLNHFLKAVDARGRVMERRAKLNGLDAPIRVDAKVEHTTPVDAELQRLLDEAHERAEADKQRLAQQVGEVLDR